MLFAKSQPKSESVNPRGAVGTRAGRWVFVEDEKLSPEQRAQIEAEEKDEVMQNLRVHRDPNNPFAILDEFWDYYPGKNKVPDDGAWIMVKQPPGTEYTVPPLSFWFATPWFMECVRLQPNRVKIVTPMGDLGLFPHEYILIDDPGKMYEFVGDGISVHFFGKTDGVPRDKLFYLRSRGISKRDAMVMLIGSIKEHGVLWLETERSAIDYFGFTYPPEDQLATKPQHLKPKDGSDPAQTT